jgi:glycosyltransferase involved in cell wall biosynthesis
MIPKISIIIPSYNQGNYIERAIESIICQNYSNLEIILIDGGSTDNSVEIIKKYQKHFSYWVSENDFGQSDAMNKGLSKATGDIIGILNTDDEYQLGCFNNIVNCYTKNSLAKDDLFIMLGDLEVIDSNDNIQFINKPSTELYKLFQWWRFPMPNNPSAYFYSYRIHSIIGNYNIKEHFALDYDFLLRAFCVAKVLYIEKVLGKYRIYPGTKTFERDWEEVKKNALDISLKYAGRLNSFIRKLLVFSYFFNTKLKIDSKSNRLSIYFNRIIDKIILILIHKSSMKNLQI